MYYIEIPGPVEIKLRTGERLRETVVKNGQPVVGGALPAMTIFQYAECWWNHERLNAGGIKGRRITEKLIAAFDEAKSSKAKYIAVEDAWYERFSPIVEDATYFAAAPLEIQCFPFPQAVLDATRELPAHLQPKSGGKKAKAEAT